jgi:serine/threonine protein kinase
MSKTGPGRCPTCEAAGDVGQPCEERVCVRQATHFVPEAEALRVLAEPATSREPLVGQFVGDYLIVGRLGRGGFGRVLLGLQRPSFRLRAAVKLIEAEHRDASLRQKALAKFEAEADALAILQSPHVVRLLQFGSFHGRPFLAMEYVPGARTLKDELAMAVVREARLPNEVIKRLVEQILNGLEAAHREGIIHRDIKPDNIMLQDVVGDRWFVKIVDFGLARVQAERSETSSVVGTVTYMAPEQIEGRNIGPWTDLYALGVIAFELLTGQRLWSDHDTQRVIGEKLDPRFDPLARAPAPDLRPEVQAFLTRALSRAPEGRFRSTEELRLAWQALFDASDGGLGALTGAAARPAARPTVTAPLPAPLQPTPPTPRRYLPWLAGGLASAAVTGAILLAPRDPATTSPPPPPAELLPLDAPSPAPTAPPALPAQPAKGPRPPVQAPPTPPAPASTLPLSPPTPPEPAPTLQVFAVSSRPPGARLKVDGVPLGETPVDVSARPGALLTLELEAPGFKPLRESVEVSSRTGPLELRLVPLPSRRASAPPRPSPTTAPTPTGGLKPVYID